MEELVGEGRREEGAEATAMEKRKNKGKSERKEYLTRYKAKLMNRPGL